LRFQRGIQSLDSLLHFETTPRQMPNVSYIRKYLTLVKIREGMGEMSMSERSHVLAPAGSCRYSTCFSISKPQCVKANWCRKSRPDCALFHPPV